MALPRLAPAAGRVRRVRLRAADQDLVRRGAVLLEDALQTAASGVGRRGRLTVVRTLTVGRIASDRAPAHLSHRLADHLRQLADGARHWSDPDAAGAAAVYFEDEIAPYLGLADCLATGAAAEAWFWPLAVPGWRPASASGPALRALLFEVARATRAGPLAAVELVRTLHERGRAEALLGVLGPDEGPTLLALFACTTANPGPPPPPAEAEPTDPLPPPAWAALLAVWIRRWGERDPRSTWLGVVSLLAERPARMLDPALRQRAERLVRGLAGPHQETRLPTPRPAHQPSGRAAPPLVGPSLGADDSTPTKPTAGLATVSPPRSDQAAEQPGGSGSGRLAAPPVGPVAEGLGRGGALPATEPAAGSPGGSGRSRPRQPAALARPRADPAGPEPRLDRPAGADRPSRLDRSTGRSRGGDPEQTIQPGPAPTSTAEAWLTDYAGLFFLLPALARLGMAELLLAWPGLIDLDLPVRVLAEVARRAGAPDDDPVWRVLPGLSAASPGRYEFSLPPRLRLLASPGPWLVRREAGPAGARALVDRSERLTLAVWRGRTPAPVRALLDGRRAGPGRRLPPGSTHSLLLESWHTALRRWCRRGPGLSLAEVARRPGRLLVTRTHLDLYFDPRQADVRIRRAGLDLDPGWSAWFGRVVLFHYQERV